MTIWVAASSVLATRGQTIPGQTLSTRPATSFTCQFILENQALAQARLAQASVKNKSNHEVNEAI